MQKLKLPTSVVPVSPGSRRGSGTALRARKPNDPPPRIFNQLTDADIPRSAWSAWQEEGKPRQLCRELTGIERTALEARRDELAPMVAPFGPGEADAVALALVDMFTAFRSMRQTGDEAVALVESTRRALQDFPQWAIQKACRSIQTNGVWRDGKFDRQWPPSDPEVVDAVRKELRLYADQHRSAVALLDAKVEER